MTCDTKTPLTMRRSFAFSPDGDPLGKQMFALDFRVGSQGWPCYFDVRCIHNRQTFGHDGGTSHRSQSVHHTHREENTGQRIKIVVTGCSKTHHEV